MNSLQELEGILTEGLVARVIGEIEFYVLFRQFDSFCRRIDAMHEFSPATHSIKREATRIAEHIQHTLTLRELLQQRTILALVNKEARFLAFQPVDTELQAILQGDIVVRTANQKAIHIIRSHKRQRCLTLIINM